MLKAEEVNAILLERVCQSAGSLVFKVVDVGHGTSVPLTEINSLITSQLLANWIDNDLRKVVCTD